MNESTGLELRYAVQRLGDVNHKHDDCGYFVLDPVHDVASRAALLAYANACEERYALLAADIRAWVESLADLDGGS